MPKRLVRQARAKRRNNSHTTEAGGATVGYEAELWRMAGALRGAVPREG